MMRTAVISNGIVVNVIEASDGFTLPGMTLVASASAGIGDTYTNGTFARPAPVVHVPAEVTDLQARLALIAVGKLAAVEAVVAAADDATKAWFDRALIWRRDSPIISALAPALGLTSADLDALFIDAAGR